VHVSVSHTVYAIVVVVIIIAIEVVAMVVDIIVCITSLNLTTPYFNYYLEIIERL